MGWKERLLAAKYRGVPFFVDDAQRKGGRRYEVHELPQADLPLLEDLGKLPTVFAFDAYVLGDDYLDQKERLLAACEGPALGGRGTLIHPYYGVLSCLCTKVTVSENRRDGRMARFGLEFTRVNDQLFQPEARSPDGAIESAGEDLEDAGELDLADEMEGTGIGIPETVREGSANSMRELGQKLKELDIFSGIGQEAADMAKHATDLVDNAASLAAAPANAAFAVRAAVSQVAASVRNAVTALGAYKVLLGLPPPLLTSGSDLDNRANRNARLVNDFGRMVAASGAAQAAAAAEWESYDQAVDTRDSLVAEFDDLLERASRSTYGRIQQLAAVMVQVIPREDQDLPRLSTYTPRGTTPALVVAYRLYQDPERAGEIARRNQIAHPGMLPGGRALEVLVSG